MPPKIARYFIMPAILYLAFIAVYVLWSGAEARQEALGEIDRQLFVAASALPGMLASDFHDRAVGPDSIGRDEELENRQRFNNYAAASGFVYVYTLVERQGGLYFTAPTVTAEEAQERESWYFYPYEKAPSEFLNAIASGEPAFVSYTDEWGAFRSAAVPLKSPGGLTYLACADVDASFVYDEVMTRQFRAMVASGLFMLLAVPFLLAARKASRVYAEHVLRLAQHNLDLKRRAEFDGLTGILNRQSFFDLASKIMGQMRESGSPGAILMLDVDDFKSINDTFGHLVGDEVIAGVAKACSHATREYDLVGRFGGEEFVVFLTDVNKRLAQNIAERVRERVAAVPVAKGRSLTASVGMAWFARPDKELHVYVGLADAELIMAKRAGKDQVRLIVA